MNIAIELNGQPPLQVYVKPCREYKIILRSIDLGAMEVVTTYGEVRDFMQVGSPSLYLKRHWCWQVSSRAFPPNRMFHWKSS